MSVVMTHQSSPESVPLIEGGVDRRLGAPGGEAQLRLEMTLPAPDDWRRSPLEVLWEMMPALLGSQLPGVMARVDGDVARIESRIEAEAADLELRRLRLQLARIAAESGPVLESEAADLYGKAKATVERMATAVEDAPGPAGDTQGAIDDDRAGN